jgi:NADH-quinone oxidoreductase subunit H
LGAPFLTFYLSLLNWLVLPLDLGLAISEVLGGGILILIAISELSIYGVIFSGWAANSKYPFLGSLRSTAQMISYSVSLSLMILCIIYLVGSVEPLLILESQRKIAYFYPLLPIAILFLIATIAEVNRAPFDLPEGESELVAGFFTEHSAVGFAFFFLGEYTNILTLSTFYFIFFFGIEMALPIIFFILWIRASLARLRFDQLLHLGWAQI